jgi:hypothetical protein
MRTLLVFIFLTGALVGHGQSPPGINYQGVARDPDGKPISQKDISIRITIVKDNSDGVVEYAEVHTAKTNSFGLFTLVIGEGNVQSGDFQFISWAAGNKWLRVEMDTDGGSAFKLMGSQQLMSVPYALYSKYAGSSPLSAGQGVSINNNVISNTGDADNNPANEYNTDFTLDSNNKLKITDGGGAKEVDLSGLIMPSMPQDLSLNGNKLKVTDNASATEIDLSPYLDNTDNQDLALTGNTLSLTNDATPIDLAPYLDNTDAQSLSATAAGTNRTIAISGGNSVTVDVADNDNNSANEIQDLSLTGNTLALSGDATTVNLTPFLDNTDAQSLSATAAGTNRTIAISGGNSVTVDVADNDNNSANEIQDLSLTGNTLTLSGDATTVNLTPYLDNTDNQDLTLNANVLSLTNDATPINLAPYLDNTDAQSLSLSGTTLSILNGNSISLAGLLDNTDNQDLSLTGNMLSLTGDATPVNLAPYLDNTDSQSLSLSATGTTRTINIAGGTGVAFSVADNDNDSANEIQSLSYDNATKSLAISLGNSVVIPETQTLNNVLTQGNDAGGQKITNLGTPAANTDAATKQYVDNTINSRISTNYAFKTNYSYSSLLTVAEVTMTLGSESFDDFDVVGTTNFTAPVAGTYVFILGGTASSGGINLSCNGTKYPVPIANSAFNATFMFRLSAGETLSVVATGLGLGTNISGSFYGYKLL